MSDTLSFVHPVIVKNLKLPGPGAVGSETETLGGVTVVLRGPTDKGKATISYIWESWTSILSLLNWQSSGTQISVSFPGYSGYAVIPVEEGSITWKAEVGDDAAQDEISGGPLDLYNGDVNLILLAQSN